MSSFQVDRTKWAKMSIFEQMGNIYSEVGRSFSALKSGDSKRAQAASARALDLFDATAEVLSAQHSPKLKEVLLVREVFVEQFESGEDDGLDDYFMPFAIVARKRAVK